MTACSNHPPTVPPARFDRRFAAPGTVLMRPEVNVRFLFESRYGDERHPHDARFLELVPERRTPEGARTRLRLHEQPFGCQR
jgi:hypothetical protein